MAKDYTSIGNTALRLITKFGRVVQVVKINTNPQDSNRSWRGSEGLANISVDATAVFVDPVSEKDLGNASITDGDSTRHGTATAFIAAFENPTIDLSDFHRVIDNGLVFTIEEIHTLSPGPTALLYQVMLVR